MAYGSLVNVVMQYMADLCSKSQSHGSHIFLVSIYTMLINFFTTNP